MNILKVIELTKKYKDVVAVDNVSLTVQKGDILGIVGENGAGKSTLLKMITNSVFPTKGTVLFEGEGTGGHRLTVGGYVNVPKFYETMSAKENVEVIKKLVGKEYCLPTKDVLELVGLADVGKKRVSNFSLGMKQRLALAMSLVTQPDIIILDEPLNGLDPHGIQEFRELIINLSETKGITFIISSHLLLELEKIASRYVFMKKGKIVRDITESILDASLGNSIKFTTNDYAKVKMVLEDVIDMKSIGYENNNVTINCKSDVCMEIVKKIDGLASNLIIERQDLESYYKNLMGRN